MKCPHKDCRFLYCLLAIFVISGIATAQNASGVPQSPNSNASSSQRSGSAVPGAGSGNIRPIGPADFSVGAARQAAATATQAPTGSGTSANSTSTATTGTNAGSTPSGSNAAAAPESNNNSGPAPAGTMTNPNTVTSPGVSTSVTPNGVMSNQKPAGTVAPESANLLIGNGDLIEVSVYAAPDFDKNVRVDENGNASLPMVGPVKLSGLTISQAETLIAKRLAEGEFFNNPQVTVFIKEYATQGISILGEVQRPGVYPVLGPRTLFDAISLAGGTTPKAGNVVTITRRAAPREPIIVKLSNQDAKMMEGNVDIYPGDTVVIAQAGIVYVVGDVRTPGGYVMDNGRMSLLQALAMAQGANGTAALSRARLVRKGPGGVQEEMPLPLDQIVSGKKADMPLQAEDIVFVPNSAGKSAMRRGLESVIQAATGIAIYRR